MKSYLDRDADDHITLLTFTSLDLDSALHLTIRYHLKAMSTERYISSLNNSLKPWTTVTATFVALEKIKFTHGNLHKYVKNCMTIVIQPPMDVKSKLPESSHICNRLKIIFLFITNILQSFLRSIDTNRCAQGFSTITPYGCCWRSWTKTCLTQMLQWMRKMTQASLSTIDLSLCHFKVQVKTWSWSWRNTFYRQSLGEKKNFKMLQMHNLPQLEVKNQKLNQSLHDKTAFARGNENMGELNSKLGKS